MKRFRLILLRHAKSSWTSNASTDHERPLNKRGERDAPRMGKYLSAQGWLPTRVISSDSRRTRQTVARLVAEIEVELETTFTRDLYHAGLNEIRAAVTKLAADQTEVMVVGHNPGWEEAVEQLSGSAHRFTTCNAAVFEVEARNWDAAFGIDRWELLELARPKELPDDVDG